MKPNSTEWYAARKGGIGASDAPIVMRLSKYRSVHQLYREKTEPDIDKPPETANFAQQHGIDTEPQAVQLFLKQTGIDVEYGTDNMMIWPKDAETPWAFATFDFFTYDDPFNEDTFGEIKCPLTCRTHEMAMDKSLPLITKDIVGNYSDGRMPIEYYTQMQYQHYVYGRRNIQLGKNPPKFGYYVSYFKHPETEGELTEDERMERNYVCLEVPRDDEYIKKVLAECAAFWHLVETKTPPLRKSAKPFAPVE